MRSVKLRGVKISVIMALAPSLTAAPIAA